MFVPTDAIALDWYVWKIQAYIWWCGDDVCDCTEPLIDVITPNEKAGYPWIERTTIWRGTFRSRDSERGGDPQEELIAACDRYGIKPITVGDVDTVYYGRPPDGFLERDDVRPLIARLRPA